MAHKLVTDMRVERFRAWQDLLRGDQALSHRVGILAVRDEGETFKPGVQRNDLPAFHDPDYRAMNAYHNGLAFDYPYEASVSSVTEAKSNIAPGCYACLLVFDNDVSLGELRPRIDELIATRQAQAAAAETPPGAQAGAA